MIPRCARLITPLAAACAATLLVACGSGEEEPQAPGDEQILDKQWQVVSINTTPDAASTIPESIPQAPTLSFGESTLVGTTGCTQMVGKVTYSADEERQISRTATACTLMRWIMTRPPRIAMARPCGPITCCAT